MRIDGIGGNDCADSGMNGMVNSVNSAMNSGLFGRDRMAGNARRAPLPNLRAINPMERSLCGGERPVIVFFSLVFRWENGPNGVPRLPWSHCLNFCHISYSVFRIAQSLFFWELIFCMFCYSYTGIGIDETVPKECALSTSQYGNLATCI